MTSDQLERHLQGLDRKEIDRILAESQLHKLSLDNGTKGHPPMLDFDTEFDECSKIIDNLYERRVLMAGTRQELRILKHNPETTNLTEPERNAKETELRYRIEIDKARIAHWEHVIALRLSRINQKRMGMAT